MTCFRIALVTLVALSLGGPVHGQEPAPDPTSDPESFARELIAAWNSTEIDRILEFYDDQAVYEDVPNVENGWAEPWWGREMIREALAGMFSGMPDLRFEQVSVWPSGRRMVAEWVMTGTHDGDFAGLPATGRSITIRGVSLLEFENGKIMSQRDYYDMFLFLSQLGVVPPLGGE